MTKTLYSFVGAVLSFALAVLFVTLTPTSSNAGFVDDLGQFVSTFGTAHEQNGYRDTGCDPAYQVQITNSNGDYLYSNNPTCPMPKDNEDTASVPDEETPVDPPKELALAD